jgi:hypothetical protein
LGKILGKIRLVLRLMLKVESRFPGRIGKSRYAAVVAKRAAIEANLRNACRLRPGGHFLTDSGCGSLVTTEPDTLTQFFVHGARRHKRAACGIVNNLGVDVFAGTKHREPGTIGSTADMAANAIAATLALTKNGSGVVHG